MDALFNQCFFHALKCKVKKSDLPLLTSTFLRSHMFSCWYVVRFACWVLVFQTVEIKCEYLGWSFWLKSKTQSFYKVIWDYAHFLLWCKDGPDQDMHLVANWSWLTLVSGLLSHLNGCLPTHRNVSTSFTHHVLFSSVFEVVLSLICISAVKKLLA